MELVKPIKTTSVDMQKTCIVEFKDEDGKIKRGKLKSNDGYSVVVLIGTRRLRLSRREITFVKE